MRENIVSIVGGCVVVILVVFVLSIPVMGWPIKIINPGDAAIFQRFGKLDSEVKTEGMYVKVFSKKITYNVREEVLNSEESAATKDLQDIKVHITVNYKFDSSKIVDTYKQFGKSDMVVGNIIKPRISSRLKSETANYSAENIIHKRAEVTDKVRKNLEEELLGYNVIITGVELKNIAFVSADFNSAIESKQIAEQNLLRSKFELDKSKIDAERVRVESESLTPQYLERKYIDKWDGKLPQYMGEGANLFIQPK